MGTLFGIKGIAVLALIAGIAFCAWRTTKILFPPPPKPPHSWSFAVESVPNGSTIMVKSGLRERKTATISLADIAAPPTSDDLAEASRANLERLAGTRIRVETPRGRLFGAVQPEVDDAYEGLRQQDDSPEATAEEPGIVESRATMVGVVFGETGACLNLAQIMDGLATCLPSAPKEWKQQEALAKKTKHRGG